MGKTMYLALWSDGRGSFPPQKVTTHKYSANKKGIYSSLFG